MLDEILELNRAAAVRGDFEVAYHLLMAALHQADRDGDEDALARLSKIAQQQSQAVEAVRPAHQLSREHAHARGQTPLFDSFQAHIDAVRLRMHSARQLAQRPR